MAIATQPMTTQQIMNIRASNGLDIVAGLWLVVSPFILAFVDEPMAMWNTLGAGAVVALLAAGRSFGSGYRYEWPSWVSLLAGIWLVAAPFFLGFISSVALWNSIVLGLIVIALSGWSIASTPTSEEA